MQRFWKPKRVEKWEREHDERMSKTPRSKKKAKARARRKAGKQNG